jgi:threonine aldolase
LTLEDVQKNAVTDDDVHSCPTRVISLENTLNGMIMPLDEVKRIAAFAREHDIRLHCDGARLWEAVAAGAGSLVEYCSYFDTVTLCFSKGLGAPIGSILVGSKATVKHSRWVRKSIGGGLRQAGVVTAPARVALDETFHGGLLKASHECAKDVETIWTDLGGKLIHPVDTNMCWLDLESAGCSNGRFEELGKEAGLKLLGNRLVVHYQIAQKKAEVLPRLQQVFRKAFDENNGAVNGGIGESNMYKTQ